MVEPISQAGGSRSPATRQTEITNWNQFQNALFQSTGNRTLQPGTNNIASAMLQLGVIVQAASNQQFVQSLTAEQRNELDSATNKLKETIQPFLERSRSFIDLARGPR